MPELSRYDPTAMQDPEGHDTPASVGFVPLGLGVGCTVQLDPFQTSAAEMADLWLRPRPGTDGAIALAMTKVLIDEGLYDRDDVANWCYGFDALAVRVSVDGLSLVF